MTKPSDKLYINKFKMIVSIFVFLNGSSLKMIYFVCVKKTREKKKPNLAVIYVNVHVIVHVVTAPGTRFTERPS